MTKQLCAPISESYLRMIGKGIKGGDVYAFDEELTSLMRAAGAYVLPLQVRDVNAKASYFNPDWDQNDPTHGGNREFVEFYTSLTAPEYKDMPNGPYYEAGGIIKTSANSLYSYILLKNFYDLAINQKKFEVKKFDFTFDFIHGYLFILPQDPSDINQETIFLYVDFPFSIHGNEYGKISSLAATEKTPEVRCYERSISQARRHWVDNKDFIAGKEFVSRIEDFSHLNLSFSEHRILEKPVDEINASHVAEPSLKCWMQMIDITSNDYSECLNTGYDKEFMSMLNRDVCVGFDAITPAPKRSYPYKVYLGDSPIYDSDIAPFSNRCKNENVILPRGENEND